MTAPTPDEMARWVALSLIPNLGRKTIDRLLDHFGTLAAILAAPDDALRAVPRVGPKLAAAIRAADVAHTQAALHRWQAGGIAVLLHTQDGYPAALRALDDAPPVLFVRGSLLPTPAVAIVGTRRPRPQAAQIAGDLAARFAARGWTITSGLAAGIDTAAHQGALHAGGRTQAVLGCGVRVVYPPENERLAAQIVAQGALLSETDPDAPPNSPALVARNRLISGLSRAVIVVETGTSGGSLHAVRFAQAQGRPVYALDSDAPGNRQLIAAGAQPLPRDPAAWDTLGETVLET